MEKIYKILPKYAFIPIITCVVLNGFVYFGSRIITTHLHHYNFSIILDDKMPFVSPMILIYVLAYVMWVVGFVVIGRESREVCYDVLAAEQIAKLMCLICFFVIPSTIVRPEITGTTIFDRLTNLIYASDTPDNLFPSIHCLESWICFRGAMRCKKVGSGYRAVMMISAFLVFASTLLVKQHVFMDVIGGVAVAEAGLLLVKKIKISGIYYSIESKLERNGK